MLNFIQDVINICDFAICQILSIFSKSEVSETFPLLHPLTNETNGLSTTSNISGV